VQILKGKECGGGRTPNFTRGDDKRLQEEGVCSLIETNETSKKSRQLRIQYKENGTGETHPVPDGLTQFILLRR